MSSNVWKKQKIGEIALINMGQSPESEYYNYERIGLPFLQGNRTFGFKYPSYDTFCSSGNKFADPNDILISVRAPVGDLNITRERICIGRGLAALKMKNGNYEYLFYLLKSNIQELINRESGTVFGSINKDDIYNLEVIIAQSDDDQRRIAEILSALDDKIELNRQTNATLEAIAQAIFKEWFVNFNFPGATGEMVESELGMIPKGWRVGVLGDVCKNIRKGVHPKDIASDTAYVGLEHIPRKSLGIVSWGLSEDVDSQKTHFKKYDVLFGKLRPYFHKVCIAPVDGICSTDILVIEPNQHDYFSFCLNHLFSDELITYVSSIADGTRMPRVDWNSISNYQILIPNHELHKEFNKITFPSYDSIIENNQESATLAALRDNLLPKLMNGEIDL